MADEKHTPDVEDEWVAVDEMHARLVASVPPGHRENMRKALGIVTDVARAVQKQSQFFETCHDASCTVKHELLPAEGARRLANAFLRFTAGQGFSTACQILEALQEPLKQRKTRAKGGAKGATKRRGGR